MQGWLQEPEEQLDSALLPAQAQTGPDTGVILHPSLGSRCSPSQSWILPRAQLPLLPGWMGPSMAPVQAWGDGNLAGGDEKSIPGDWSILGFWNISGGNRAQEGMRAAGALRGDQ